MIHCNQEQYRLNLSVQMLTLLQLYITELILKSSLSIKVCSCSFLSSTLRSELIIGRPFASLQFHLFLNLDYCTWTARTVSWAPVLPLFVVPIPFLYRLWPSYILYLHRTYLQCYADKARCNHHICVQLIVAPAFFDSKPGSCLSFFDIVTL